MAKDLFIDMDNFEIVTIGKDINYFENHEEIMTFIKDYYISSDNMVTKLLLMLMRIINNAKDNLEIKENQDIYINNLKKLLNILINSKSNRKEILNRYLKDIPENLVKQIDMIFELLNKMDLETFEREINNSINEIKLAYYNSHFINSRRAVSALKLANYIKAKLYRLNGFQEITLEELELIMFIVQKEFLKNGYTAFNDPIIVGDNGPMIKSLHQTFKDYKEGIKTLHEDIKSYIYIPTTSIKIIDEILIRLRFLNKDELNNVLKRKR